jgi:hypothetical protein
MRTNLLCLAKIGRNINFGWMLSEDFGNARSVVELITCLRGMGWAFTRWGQRSTWWGIEGVCSRTQRAPRLRLQPPRNGTAPVWPGLSVQCALDQAAVSADGWRLWCVVTRDNVHPRHAAKLHGGARRVHVPPGAVFRPGVTILLWIVDWGKARQTPDVSLCLVPYVLSAVGFFF